MLVASVVNFRRAHTLFVNRLRAKKTRIQERAGENLVPAPRTRFENILRINVVFFIFYIGGVTWSFV